ncbi:hypothetical protein EIP91_010644 [Steccherinum ochraceum]|uniref:Protein kinase domain-containing protein n=1 Tax=Steccherinum ochraceum TaxID=92696 RepID=A0A4V2MV40_9APHY|nr:hypothetical protein EIP91_010644 [Steccherinum ochraceum]
MPATYTLLPHPPYLLETTESCVRAVPLLQRYLQKAQYAGTSPAPSPNLNSSGSAADVAQEIDPTENDYRPFLEHDLENTKVLSFPDFCRVVLGLSSDWTSRNHDTIVQITKEDEYLDKLKAGARSGKKEISMCVPFVELLNHIIEQLKKRFADELREEGGVHSSNGRDDPAYLDVERSDSNRKSNLSPILELNKESTQSPEAYLWADLLAFVQSGKPKFVEIDEGHLVSSPVATASPSGVPPSTTQEPDFSGSALSATVHSTPTTAAGTKRKIFSTDESTSSDHAQSKKQKIHLDESDDRYVQCASYAQELLSDSGWRSHVIGILVTGDEMECLYYDHSIIVRSEKLNFYDDPLGFVTAVFGIYHAGDDPRDRVDAETGEHVLKTEVKKPTMKIPTTCHVRLQDGTVLELQETLYLQHWIIGRGTCVVRVKVKESPVKSHWSLNLIAAASQGEEGKATARGLVMKLSWPSVDRLKEDEVLKTVREKAKELGDEWVLEHLPEVLYSEDHSGVSGDDGLGATIDNTSISSDDVQARLAEHYPRDQYERRVLRIIIQPELKRVRELTDVKVTYTVFFDVFKCYRWLYEKCNIVHRDLSHSNILWDEGTTGRVVGVLNDFDLVSYRKPVTDTLPSSEQRTGTKPFMAIELLQDSPPIHDFRHDLESLFYVMLWHTRRYRGGRLVSSPPYEDWARDARTALRGAKVEVLMTVPVSSQPQHAELEPLLDEYRTLLREGYYALSRSEDSPIAKRSYVTETMGGNVTFDKIHSVFVSNAPHGMKVADPQTGAPS